MKTMVITGASSGLGKALAIDQASKGNNVCAIGRNEKRLAELKALYPEKIDTYAGDVSKSADVLKIFAEIAENHEIIDLLVNNAGTYNAAPFAEETIENIDRIIDTNLKGVMYCTHAALPAMLKHGKGRIINISSISGISGFRGESIYGSSKHGLQGFAEVIGQELKEHNILVTNICPGGIKTPLWNSENPYHCVEDNLTQVEELTGLVDFILNQPERTLYKKVVLFPKTEWCNDD